MELFTELEITIMVSIVGFLVFIILLLSCLELISRRKEKKKNIILEETELEEPKESKVEIEQLEEDVYGELSIDKIEAPTDTEDDYNLEVKSNIDINKEQVNVQQEENTAAILKPQASEILIEELETPSIPQNTVIETLESEPQEKARIELLKVEEELKHPVPLEETISNIEAMEEESAIISYQELLDVTREMNIIQQEDVGDEPISITEVYEKFTGDKLEHPSIDDIYQASLVNSSETENLNEIQLENTANLEKLDKEIRKTNKVLNMLNELKKNLD